MFLAFGVTCIAVSFVSIYPCSADVYLRYVLDMSSSGGTPKRMDFRIVLLPRFVLHKHITILAHFSSTRYDILHAHTHTTPVCIP